MLAEATTAVMRGDVLAALKQASAATGSDFSYLLSTAMRESSLSPHAKSATSTASGLFQFVEQTWLGLVKQYGAKHGLASFANAISEGASGHLEVDDPGDRQAILALRNDPRISALMAGEYANQTRSTLEVELGRNVSNGELYAAHLLGPEAACRLIRMSSAQPQSCAATAFPHAASANRSVFYRPDGSAKSIREVYDWALKQLPAAGAEPEQLPQPGLLPDAGWARNPESWSAVELMTATGPSTPAAVPAAFIPQAPFATTPDVLDLIGSMWASEATERPASE